MRTAQPGAAERPADHGGDSKRTAADKLLHSVLGTVLAVAVAALALWPHVKSLLE